jgi:hypothetical protein
MNDFVLHYYIFLYCSKIIFAAKTIDIYHSDDNKWKHYCDLPEPRRHFSVTMQNGKVYLTGNNTSTLYII